MSEKMITVPADIEELSQVLEFVDIQLKLHGCPVKTQRQIDIAVEEIFVNIARYAYETESGEATVCCTAGGEPLQVTVQFLDGGKPYNPLAAGEPDITLSAQDRPAGGLGIYMVKKSMDEIFYEYRNGKNVLTIKKGWEG